MSALRAEGSCCGNEAPTLNLTVAVAARMPNLLSHRFKFVNLCVLKLERARLIPSALERYFWSSLFEKNVCFCPYGPVLEAVRALL